MTTSSSSVIIILVLNIFFSTPSFVSSTERRDDDLTLSELQTLVQQQGVTIQQQAALLQTLQAKLTADESTIHQQAASLQTLQAKVTADESTAHQQAVTFQQQAALLQTLQTKLTADESAIHQLQAKQSTIEARQNKNVAFTATFPGGDRSVNIGVRGIVKFNNVITNIGGAYNAATGIFTAPIAGTYAFFFNGQSDNVHQIFMEVSKNGNGFLCRTTLEDPAHDFYDKGTCFAVSHLNAGDQVFARQYLGGTYIDEREFSSLSGFLVQAD